MPSSSELVAAEAIRREPETPASWAKRFITNSAIGDRQMLPWQIKRILVMVRLLFRKKGRLFPGDVVYCPQKTGGGNMELPAEVRQAVEDAARRVDRRELAEAARELSRKYRDETGRGRRLAVSAADAAAYAAVRMPATYAAVAAALTYARQVCDPEIRTVLDAGAGTGAAEWAAAGVLGGDLHYTLVEREPAMAGLGRELMARAGFPGTADWVNGDLRDLREGERCDLVVSSYALGELTPEDRAAAAERLWGLAGKLLLLVEPGTPAAYGQLMELRRRLVRIGARVAAPCPYGGECPLPEGDWCHFTCRVARSRLHKQLKGGDAPYEDEKFSYLALVRQEVSHAGGRVLRHPTVEPGRISLHLCTPEGIGDVTVTKSMGGRFKTARKLASGDIFL